MFAELWERSKLLSGIFRLQKKKGEDDEDERRHRGALPGRNMWG